MATRKTFGIAKDGAVEKWESIVYDIRELKSYIRKSCGFCKLQQYDGQLCNKCPAINICGGIDYLLAQEHLRKAEQAVDNVIIAIRNLEYKEV